MERPALIASGILSMVANISSNPTALRTLPSITPMGGTKKPPTISKMLTTRLILKTVIFQVLFAYTNGFWLGFSFGFRGTK